MEIAIKNVKKVTKNHSDINGITLNIKSNEVIGVIGADGAGKTTLMRLLTTYYAPDDGEILYDGVSIYKDKSLYKSNIGYMPRANPLIENMSVNSFLKFVAKASGMPQYLIPTRIMDVLRECHLEVDQNSPIKYLSRGAKRRVGIAQAVIHRPALLLLDHPTAELDPKQAENIREIIKTQTKGRTTILCSQNTTDIWEICSRIIFLNKGVVTADTTIEELKELKYNTPIYKVILSPSEPQEYVSEILNLKGVEKVECNKGAAYVYTNSTDCITIERDIFELCMERGWYINNISKLELTNEEILKRHLYNL